VSRRPGGAADLRLVAGLALVLGVALAARLAPAAEAFQTGAFVPTDSDALYQLRRMQLTAEAWPQPSAVDPWLAWPSGGPIPWAPGFDLAGAAVLAAGAASPVGGWLSVGLFHLALGLLLVALAVELVLALLPPRPGRLGAALAAGLLVALLPQAAESTKLGMIDHHVVEALILLLLARWALAAEPAGRSPARRRAGFEAIGAALSGGAVLCFTGSPLYVALVLPLLAGPILAAERPRLAGSGAPALLGGALLSAAGTAPFVAAHGRALAFGFPSWLQPLLLAAAAAGLGAAVLAGRLAPALPRWRRPALLLLLGGAGLALGLLALPRIGAEGLAGLQGWLLRRDPWLARVDEFQPMWKGSPAEALGSVWRFLAWPGLLVPLAVPCAVAALAPAGWRRALGVGWLVLSTAGLALLQVRFGRVAAPWVGVGLGLALAWPAARLGARAGAGAGAEGGAVPRWRAWLGSALPLCAVVALAVLDPRLQALLRRGSDPVPDATVELGLELGRWPADPAAPGVLAPWDFGNHALVLGGRPVVANGFGSYPDARAFEDAERAFRVGEAELLELARTRRVGVVVAGPALPFSGKGVDAAWLRAVPSAPLLIGGSGVPALGLRHFEHVLPRLASTRAVVGIDRPLPVLWVYELVAGARLEGRAAPGTRVVLEIPLSEHGRAHTWRAFTDAGADGRFALTVPLPTDLTTPTVRTGVGRLLVGGGPARPQAVPEAAVRAGQLVAAAPAPR